MCTGRLEFLKFIEKSKNEYYPLYNLETLEFAPKIDTSMKKPFYYAVSIVCILHVSNQGFKCFGQHNKKQQCGNSKFLNDHFSSNSFINLFYLCYNNYGSMISGEYDYEFLERLRRTGLNYIVEPLKELLFLMFLVVSTGPLFICLYVYYLPLKTIKRIYYYRFLAIVFEIQFRLVYTTFRKLYYMLQ